MNSIKKSILVGLTLFATSTLIFSFTNDNGDKKKKYHIIHQSKGETLTYDTILPMTSSYTPEQFLKDKGISDKNVEIVVLPALSEGGEETKKMKTIVREMKIDENGDASSEEKVEIKVEMDENGNMTTKKTVNGVEVEMTEEELNDIKRQGDENMIQLRFPDEEMGMPDERVEIKVEMDDNGNKTVKKMVNGEEVEMTLEELEKLEILEFKGDEQMKIIVDGEHAQGLEIEMEKGAGEDEKEIKVIKRKISYDADDASEMHPGNEPNGALKDGEPHIMIMSTGAEVDFTLVVVTENYDAANEGKTKMVFEHKTNEMNVYPNPNDGAFTIRFESDEDVKTTITVTDANGKKVFEEKLGKFSGSYEKEVDLKKFGSGMYTITIQSGDNETVQKVMIQ